jgi:hypothetical protein
VAFFIFQYNSAAGHARAALQIVAKAYPALAATDVRNWYYQDAGRIGRDITATANWRRWLNPRKCRRLQIAAKYLSCLTRETQQPYGFPADF